VIEVGGGTVFVYPGDYEDFLYWKKQREAGLASGLPTPARKSTPHLKPGEPKAEAPAPRAPGPPPPAPAKAAAAKGGPGPAKAEPQPPSYDPLKPRLRSVAAAPDRQALEREARKLKARIAEQERQIAEKEQAVRDLEQLMASPGFYDDRAQAERAVAERQRLLDEVAALMASWEELQTAAEGLAAASGPARR
jgi:hypothetical protein